MGLDTVELVIDFEDAFGVAIPNEVATQLTTPRKVTDFIMSQVVVTEEISCLSQQAFYFLRVKLMPSLNISRRDLVPNTRLESIIPLESRRLIWAGLKSHVGRSALPSLARPIWLFALLWLITTFAFISALIYAWNDLKIGSSFAFFFGLLVALSVGYIASVSTRWFKRNFRPGYQCLGEVAKHLSVHSPHVFKREQRGWTRGQAAAVVRAIIIAQVGTEDFTEDSHFIDDLHLD
jgi:hypothetical protein